MKFDELSEDQKIKAKQDYMLHLADKGVFIRTIYGKDGGKERDPSWGELADAGSLVSDETMRNDGVDYVPEDFGPTTSRECDKMLRWVVGNITMERFKKDHPKFNMNEVQICAVLTAIDWAREAMATHCSEMVMEDS